MNGRLGDLIQTIPVINQYVEEKKPKQLDCISAHDRIVLLKGVVPIDNFLGRWDGKYVYPEPNMQTRVLYNVYICDYTRIINSDPGHTYATAFSSKHMMEHQARLFGLDTFKYKQPNFNITKEEKSYAKSLLPQTKKPIVLIHTSWLGRPPYGRALAAPFWNELIQRCPEIVFIQVGVVRGGIHGTDLNLMKSDGGGDWLDYKIPTTKKTPNFIDIRSKTTVRQVIALLGMVDTFIVVDSWVNHISKLINKSGIALFGSSSANVFGYDHNINIWHNPRGCAPCIDRPETNPNDDCCQKDGINTITVDEVIKTLKKRLDNNIRI